MLTPVLRIPRTISMPENLKIGPARGERCGQGAKEGDHRPAQHQQRRCDQHQQFVLNHVGGEKHFTQG